MSRLRETWEESLDYLFKGFKKNTPAFTKFTRIGIPVVFGISMSHFLSAEVFVGVMVILMAIFLGLGFLFLYLSKRMED